MHCMRLLLLPTTGWTTVQSWWNEGLSVVAAIKTLSNLIERSSGSLENCANVKPGTEHRELSP